jgi:rhamnulokinase
MADLVFLAVDIGASSGRHVAGRFDGQRLALEEVHRFENGPVWAAGRYYWDLLRQWGNVVDGLRAAGAKVSGQIHSVGVDTWGVDFGLLGRGDELLGNPYCYRDARTNGMLERAFGIVGREEIFADTGLQFMQFNTLYQLLAMRLGDSPLLESAESLLLMPDLFHWLLTGEKANEVTIASTSQFFDPRRDAWALELLKKFQIPTQMLGTLVPSGTRLGMLLPAVATATGLNGVEVVLPGTHDTASAVMAVPAASRPGERPDWCYISSGTWSLMGVEVPEPVVTDQCLALNFTNEGGVAGTTRLLKNICGLWLVQECRRHWNHTATSVGMT